MVLEPDRRFNYILHICPSSAEWLVVGDEIHNCWDVALLGYLVSQADHITVLLMTFSSILG